MTGTFAAPTSVEETVSILADNPDVALVAGGTDLVVGARSGKRPLPSNILALHRVDELRGFGAGPDGTLRIGALVTHGELESSGEIRNAWSALADASALVGSPATRHVGTVGGNVCNASPAMELGGPLLVFDAVVELRSSTGERRLPFAEFVVGPAKTARNAREVLTSIVLPPAPRAARLGSAYVRLEYRQAMEIAIVGAAALLAIDEQNRCAAARVAVTAVAPTCVRASAAEGVLTNQLIDANIVKQAASRAAESTAPIDDVRAPAAYRRAMTAVVVERALLQAWQRAGR